MANTPPEGKGAAPPIPEVPPIVAAPKASPRQSPPKTLNICANGSITVETYGTNALGRPVVMMGNSPDVLLNNLICRDIKNPEDNDFEPSPTVDLLQSTMSAITRCEDLSPFSQRIEAISSNQREKADLIDKIITQLNMETEVNAICLRSICIQKIQAATRRTDLTVGEALAAMKFTGETLPSLQAAREKATSTDSAKLLAKIDAKQQQADAEEAKMWEGTTPQGREIIRKMLFKIMRAQKIADGTWETGLPKVEPPMEEPVDSVLEENAPPPVVTLANPP